jgi:3,4-dihydroxy 2-butanone 4-phosphate synthase / GTP cyclohydrolase II
MPQFSRIEDAVSVLAQGRMIIVVDAEDRENEGDFVMAAEKVTAESIHFMASEGRGQLCTPILPETGRRLRLKPMVARRSAGMPCFTVPVDHALCRTGISPQERAFTVRGIADPTTKPSDYVRPGHVFPLIAREGGVLERPGHTEATIDLLRIAGLGACGLLCEICSRDGKHMAKGPELFELGDRFDLPIITIDQVIEFRRGIAGNQQSIATTLRSTVGG